MSLTQTVKKLMVGTVLISSFLFNDPTFANSKPVPPKAKTEITQILGNDFAHKQIEKVIETNRFKRFIKIDTGYFFIKKDRTPEKFKKLHEELTSPKKIEQFFKTYQTYIPDGFDGHKGEDFMESPLEFYLSGTGDCEDFANFANYMLKKNNYQSCIIAGYNAIPDAFGNNGHCVCLIKNKDKFDYIDNMGLHKGFKDMTEAMKSIIGNLYIDWVKVQEVIPDYSNKNKTGCKTVWEQVNPFWLDELYENAVKETNKIKQNQK